MTASEFDTSRVSAYQALALAHMIDLADSKRDSSQTDLVDTFPSLRDLTAPTFIGSFTWMSPGMRMRWLQSKHAIQLGARWYSPAATARLYLESRYKSAGRVTTAQYQAIYRHRTQPMLAVPGVYPDMCYIDIKSAYWSILQIVGWDVDYHPAKWIGKRSDVSDFPYPSNKLARNCLVTVGLPGTINLWTGSALKAVPKKGHLTNMAIYALVLDVLNGVASDVVKHADPVYVNTDGYIVPVEKLDAATAAIDAWGLPWSVKAQGRADIRAVGVYSIGDSKHIHRDGVRGYASRRIDGSIADWLRPRIRRLKDISVP